MLPPPRWEGCFHNHGRILQRKGTCTQRVAAEKGGVKDRKQHAILFIKQQIFKYCNRGKRMIKYNSTKLDSGLRSVFVANRLKQ